MKNKKNICTYLHIKINTIYKFIATLFIFIPIFEYVSCGKISIEYAFVSIFMCVSLSVIFAIIKIKSIYDEADKNED